MLILADSFSSEDEESMEPEWAVLESRDCICLTMNKAPLKAGGPSP